MGDEKGEGEEGGGDGGGGFGGKGGTDLRRGGHIGKC